MLRVVVESPYAGDIKRNEEYARKCMSNCIKRGEAPIASHLIYTQPHILNEDVPEERQLGINAGFCWGVMADMIVFYTDLGMSKGMSDAMTFYRSQGIQCVTRSLPNYNPNDMGHDPVHYHKFTMGQKEKVKP